MAERASLYPFASGNRLDDRNTYFYTEFAGRDFLEAWRADRERVAAKLGAPAAAAPHSHVANAPADESVWQTTSLCEGLFRAFAETPATPDARSTHLLDQLIRKFETTKRIHGAYRRDDFRAVDAQDFRNPALYIRVGEILELAVARNGSLRALNALLKLLDTLCALAPTLDSAQAARLARLIAAERSHVQALAARIGVSA
jgi:hypothetical protein